MKISFILERTEYILNNKCINNHINEYINIIRLETII